MTLKQFNSICKSMYSEMTFIRVGGNSITINNLENELTMSFDEVSAPQQVFLFGGKSHGNCQVKPLMDIISKCKNPEVIGGVDSVVIADKGRFNLPAQSQECDWPVLKAENYLSAISGDDMNSHFKTLLPFLSDDELRPSMTGVYCHSQDGRFNLVATNAHILRVLPIPSTDKEFGVIVNGEAAKIVTKLPPVKAVHFYTEATVFVGDNYEFKTMNVDARYPQYDAVIPVDQPNRFQFQAEKFSDAIEVAANNSKGNDMGGLYVTTHENGLMDLLLDEEDTPFTWEDSFMAHCEYMEDPMQILFDAKLLKTLADSFSGGVFYEWSTPSRAAKFCSSNDPRDMGIIMPKLQK